MDSEKRKKKHLDEALRLIDIIGEELKSKDELNNLDCAFISAIVARNLLSLTIVQIKPKDHKVVLESFIKDVEESVKRLQQLKEFKPKSTTH